mmetsp:Transcript_10328/g.19010  ORF Transcript_10328/g.19010 Transcript_10328/m.19010 type:complete len:168 (+) Transcript_10328:87-590(+)|eukprot:CAMPEP_0184549824 /NCGR_PEP_ID=MMETSP0199_2-20130426/12324_1 /TAXON_ID=1112570 /ORGANISM="Thraustochytrium sp., Strain LLF1b" /LENGTH=167 /DNA_ID=CAMNT_0026944573 /DNA_START=21 /DNA_END=524 /DNA_ORIENTATION=+
MTTLPSDERVIELLNNSFEKKKNPSVDTLSGGNGGKITAFDRSAGTLTMIFRGTNAMCNGKPGPRAQVQGGFAGAMLDAVTAQMVVVYSSLQKTVASLEQKTVFISPVPPNTDLHATAKVIKFGRNIAFLEAELRDPERDNKLLCSSTTTISLVQMPSKQEKLSAKL